MKNIDCGQLIISVNRIESQTAEIVAFRKAVAQLKIQPPNTEVSVLASVENTFGPNTEIGFLVPVKIILPYCTKRLALHEQRRAELINKTRNLLAPTNK